MKICMEKREIKAMIQYLYEIPSMVRMLRKEKEMLEGEYSSLGHRNAYTSSHSHSNSTPTETMVILLDDKGVLRRINEISVRVQVCEDDEAAIRRCMDEMSGQYKKLLYLRYHNKYSWVKISIKFGVPDSTVRNWHDKAVKSLGKAFLDIPMAEEILDRAMRANK